jgi:CBS-domain-containing membrane protein
MKATRSVHPPACSNPLIVFALDQAPWSFLLCPTLAGAALIVVVALFYHNLRRAAPWPKYWL